jgi:hypothetical protein
MSDVAVTESFPVRQLQHLSFLGVQLLDQFSHVVKKRCLWFVHLVRIRSIETQPTDEPQLTTMGSLGVCDYTTSNPVQPQEFRVS